MSLKFLTNPPVNCIQYFRQLGQNQSNLGKPGLGKSGLGEVGLGNLGLGETVWDP